jgi:hypothetical protein
MKIPTLRSYLVPSFIAQPIVSINGKTLTVEPIRVEHWHQAEVTKIEGNLDLDLKAALEEMELGSDASIAVYVTVFSRLTKIKSVSEIVPLVSGSNAFALDLVERTMGGYLVVEVVVVCVDPGASASPLSPSSFDVLETWDFLAELEGDSPRANVQLVKFEGLKEKALWEITSTVPEDLDEWRFASVSTAIQVNLSSASYAKIQSDPMYQLQYCVDFMWESLLMIVQNEDALSMAMTDLSQCPGSLIKTSARVVHSIFGNSQPLYADILYYVQNKPSHVRAILQDRAARLVGLK